MQMEAEIYYFSNLSTKMLNKCSKVFIKLLPVFSGLNIMNSYY
jgi:hypothetical protein